MKKLFFFVSAFAILIFSIIVVNISPGIFISSILPSTSYEDCSYHSDKYAIENKKDISEFTRRNKDKNFELNKIKKDKIRCERKKAMRSLEHTAFNSDIFFGFFFFLLGFLHYLNVGESGKMIGFIGIGSGVIGFILTFLYVLESILVFNDRADLPSYAFKTDSEGAVYEWNDSLHRYTCIFYEEGNEDSIYFKFSDYNSKFLNYNKDVYFAKEEKKYQYIKNTGCLAFLIDYEFCKMMADKNYDSTTEKKTYSFNGETGECKKLFLTDLALTKYKYYKIFYYRWLATIVIGCLILIFQIGLSIFGILLIKESNNSNHEVIIKYK